MLIAQLLNLLYNIVDRIYIGKIPGEGTLALASIGLCFPFVTLITAFANLFGLGGAPLCAMARGKGNREGAQGIMVNAGFMLLLSGAVLTVLGIAFHRPLLYLFGASEVTYPYASSYIVIYLIGTLCVMLSLGLNPYINCQGFARTGMLTVALGAAANIVLDPILIFGLLGFPRMEVAGAAVATIVGQFVGAGLGLFLNLKKNPEVQIHLKDIRPHRATVADIYAIGIPSIIMQSIGSVMVFGMNKILFGFTKTATAVFGAYFKLQSFIFMPVFGLNNGMVPIVALQLRARRPDRIMKTIKLSITYAVCIMLVGLLIFQFAPTSC